MAKNPQPAQQKNASAGDLDLAKMGVENFDFDYDLPEENFTEIALSRKWYKPQYAVSPKAPDKIIPLRGDLVGYDVMVSQKYIDPAKGKDGKFVGMTIRATKHSIGVDAKDRPILIEPGDLVLMVAVGATKNILPLATNEHEVVEVIFAPQQKVKTASGNNWWEMRFGIVGAAKPRTDLSMINLAKIFRQLGTGAPENESVEETGTPVERAS